MRTLTIGVVLLLGAARALLGCSCTAPDGSCSASTNCAAGGCYAICGSGGCSAGCVDHQIPQDGPAAPAVTFSAEAVSAAELQAAVSDALGMRLLFVPKKANDRFRVELREVPAAALLKGLAKLGAVAVVEGQQGGIQGDIQEKSAAVRFSLKAENVDSEIVASLLRQLSSEGVAVRAEAPGSPVTLDLENVTLGALRGILPKLTGIRVLARPEN